MDTLATKTSNKISLEKIKSTETTREKSASPILNNPKKQNLPLFTYPKNGLAGLL